MGNHYYFLKYRMDKLYTYITEAMDELYHFTNLDNMVSIARDDFMAGYEQSIVRPSDNTTTTCFMISTTRMRYAKGGYPATMINQNLIRITLDGRAIERKYELRNWVYDSSYRNPVGAHIYRRNRHLDPYGDWTQLFEAEERIVISKGDGINDFHKFIKRIDICSTRISMDPDWEQKYDALERYCNEYGIELKLYHTVRDFDYGR